MMPFRPVSVLLAAALFLLAGCASAPPTKAAPAAAAGSPAALNEAGNRYIQKGTYGEGIRDFTEQEKQHPGNPLIPWWIGRLKYQGGTAGAADDFARASAMRPDDALLGKWVGYAYLQAGEPGKAADALRKHVPAHSGGADIRFTSQTGLIPAQSDTLSNHLGLLVTACERAGRYDEAIDAQRRIYDMDPANADYSRLSILYSAAGRFDEALESAKLALQKNEAAPAANIAMGVASEGKGRIDDAIRFYRKAIPAAAVSTAAVAAPAGREAGAGRPDPGDPSNPRSRRMASLPQAVQQKAAPQQGSPPAAAAADEGAMRLAELFLGLGDFESAEKVLRKEDRKRPGSAGLQLGWALYFQGKYPEALELADGQIRGSAYSHIGIHVETDSDGAGIRVLRLVEGAPAESAGVRAGDTITAADGEPMQGKNVPILVNKIKSGAVGVPIALTLARSGEKAPIELSVKRGVSYPNSAAGAFGLRSLVHRAMGKPGPAAEDARRLSDLAPGWFLSHYTAGLSSLDGGSAEAAASAFEKAIAAAAVRTTNGVLPETFVIHARLALAGARARQGRMDEAEALCRALPEADLTERDVPLSKSRALFLAPMKPVREGLLAAASKSEREGKPAEALPALSRALPLAESPAEAKAIRGRIVKVSSGLRSLPEVPDKARRHGVRGELFTKEGKMADALPEFRLASREAPYIPLFHMNRALVCGEVGRYEEAIRSMEEYLALSPAAPNARQGKDAVIQWELKLEQQRKDA